MEICFASHNANKVKELNQIVPKDITLSGLLDKGITQEIDETGNTLEENSLIKARHVHDLLKTPVLADDSGLLVDALNGAPGVFSARYAGAEKSDERNMELLLRNLEGETNRSAQFQTVVTYIDEKGEAWQFKGFVKGKIISEKRGDGGFGYDPVFVPEGHRETFAELSAEQKNSISHRSMAIRLFLDHLRNSHA